MAVMERLASLGLRASQQFGRAEHLGQEEAILNEHQRFELWATSLGLYHGGHSSLDYRLRDSPPLLRYAAGLLQDLETELCNYARAVPGPADAERSPAETDVENESDDGSEEDFSSYLDQPLSVGLIANIVATVDRLYTLAFKIRNPAMRLGLSKALKYTEIDRDTGADVFDGYKTADVNHLNDLFRSYGHSHRDDPEDIHFLVPRLAKANTRRRQQFKYWRKRKTNYENVMIPDPVGGGDANVSPYDSPKPMDIQIGQLALTAPSQPSSATRLDPAKVRLDEDTSVITTTSFVALPEEKDGDHVAIPPPPTLRSDAKEYECPYCCTMCPRKTFLGKAWE